MNCRRDVCAFFFAVCDQVFDQTIFRSDQRFRGVRHLCLVIVIGRSFYEILCYFYWNYNNNFEETPKKTFRKNENNHHAVPWLFVSVDFAFLFGTRNNNRCKLPFSPITYLTIFKM